MTESPTPGLLRGRPGVGFVAAVALVALLILSMLTAVRYGSVSLPLSAVVETIAHRLGLDPAAQPSLVDDQIVWQLRMPRVLAAAATGAVLALVGVVLQSITRNELADPYLLGVSGGAAVGAVSVIVLGVSMAGLIGPTMLTTAAFIGALVALAIVLALATDRSGALPPTRLILAGVAVGQVCSAATAFAVIMSRQPDAARRVLSWTLGSLAGIRWDSAVFIMLVALAASVLVMAFASQLDAFAFGESTAATLGIAVERLRWTLLVGTALLVASVVAFVGAIGFVGLVVPHVVRILFGPLHRTLLPLSALTGAILLVWTDLLARTLVPGQELPVGIVTAAVGAPVFALLLRRQGQRA